MNTSFPFEKDPVIECYKKDVDRSLIRENLKLTPEERCRKFLNFMELLKETREAGEAASRKVEDV